MHHQRALVRFIALGFFIGFNLILGGYFAYAIYGYEVGYLRPLFVTIDKQASSLTGDSTRLGELLETAHSGISERIDLRSDLVLETINQLRAQTGASELSEDERLIAAAEALALWADEQRLEFSQSQMQERVSEELEKQDYGYQRALQSIVIGPYSIAQLQGYWLDDASRQPILDSQVTQVGIATIIVNIDGVVQGATVVIAAQPQPVAVPTSPSPTSIPRSRPAVTPIPDEEVITALNQYRATHGKPAFAVNDVLCRYAEKRVQDLVDFGGLDGHAGFRADFEDKENIPAEIKAYSGTSIGENLAHQLCKNMQTGEGFVANSGTALIEWCFDSSTQGHREAQLSTTFKNVCVRHADAMYVVIFGD